MTQWNSGTIGTVGTFGTKSSELLPVPAKLHIAPAPTTVLRVVDEPPAAVG